MSSPWGVLEKASWYFADHKNIYASFPRNAEFEHVLLQYHFSCHVETFSHLNCPTPSESDVWFTVSVTVSCSHLPLLEPCLLKASLIQAHQTSDGRCPWLCHCYDEVISSVGRVSFCELHFSRSTDIETDNGSGACCASSNIYCKCQASSLWNLKPYG